jgi:hypothetical protein
MMPRPALVQPLATIFANSASSAPRRIRLTPSGRSLSDVASPQPICPGWSAARSRPLARKRSSNSPASSAKILTCCSRWPARFRPTARRHSLSASALRGADPIHQINPRPCRAAHRPGGSRRQLVKGDSPCPHSSTTASSSAFRKSRRRRASRSTFSGPFVSPTAMRPIPCHRGLAHFRFDTSKTTRTNFRRRRRRAAASSCLCGRREPCG